jgi:hypothetical protein
LNVNTDTAEVPRVDRSSGPLHFPGEDDPAPHNGRMIVVSAWGTGLVLVGMFVAVRTFIGMVFHSGPGWLAPVVIIIGIAGTALTGLAFATVHHKWLPWEVLALAGLLLAVNLILIITQF